MLVKRNWLLFVCGLFIIFSLRGIQAWPVVIALNGTSSSGKSSIAKELIRLLNSGVCVEGSSVRPFVLFSYDEFYAKNDREDGDTVSMGRESSSSSDDGDDECSTSDHNSSSGSLNENGGGEQSFAVSDQQGFFDEVLQQVIAGDDVVVDSVFDRADQILFRRLLGEYATIQFVSVYCSPRALVDHVRQRNALQTLNEQRTLYQAAIQIPDLWKISVGCDSGGEPVVDRISLDDLRFVVDSVRSELVESTAMSPLTTASSSVSVDRVLWGLEGRLVPTSPLSSDFTAGTNFIVTPRVRTACVVDSGRNTPDACAGQIVSSVIRFLGQ